MTKQRRLGRGLEALLGRIPTPAQETDPAEVGSESSEDHPYGGVMDEPYAPPSPEQASPQPETSPGLEDLDASSAAEDKPIVEQVSPAEPDQVPPTSSPDESTNPVPISPDGSQRVDVSQIDSNPFQPRQDFDSQEMRALSDSLSEHGLLQPVVVRRVDDRYQLVAGERRLRAAAQAGWADVPANIIEADDQAAAELAIVENVMRQDLNPMEKAASFQRYIEQHGCTQEELAGRLKLDRSTVANLIRLLELPEPVQNAVRHGHITQGHARALLPLGEEREQIDFCRRIQKEGLNVRQTESYVQETISRADGQGLGLVDRRGRSSPARPQNEHIAALEQELRSALGMKVKIVHNARGRGKVTIHFGNHEEFERLRRQLTEPGRPETQIQAG